MRILHVLGKLDRGGSETWLVQVLRHIDRQQYKMDFMVHTPDPGAYDDEVRSLGAQIITCQKPSTPIQYAINFHRILREHGPYDVVHSHVHHYTGYVLMHAAIAGVPIRIAHSHSDTRPAESSSGLVRQAYLKSMKAMIHAFATRGLAVSGEAGDDLFCKEWRASSIWLLQHLGIDLSRFDIDVDPSRLRRELGIANDAFVVGHAGRFTEPKNHTLLVEIAKEVVKLEPKTIFFLIGDGHLRHEIEEKVARCSLQRHFIFAGLRPDVPLLMKGVMDAFLFPSTYEGLPIALLEAQAAGLRCIISSVISKEVDIIPELVTRESLTTSPAGWARVLHSLATTPLSIVARKPDYRLAERSIGVSVECLLAVYNQRDAQGPVRDTLQ